MSKINLKDNLLIREFYERVASRDDLFPSSPVQSKQLRGICLSLLGYTTSQGKIVRPEDLEGYTYGQKPTEVKDRWEEDTEAVRSAVNGDNTSEADSSESSEDTEIRKAVLREDV